MINGKKAKSKVLGTISKIVYREASKAANSCCVVFAYQPKLPIEVKRLRKF